MTLTYPTVFVGSDAIAQLIAFCAERTLDRLFLVADTHTYQVLGEPAEASLRAAGFDIRGVVLSTPEVVADSRHIQKVLIAHDGVARTLVVIGSGTLTDIARFVSHRMNRAFIALPTAPSVDGFASSGAPLIVDGTKITYPTHAPLAIFADLDTLSAAPRPMIAAGFGDMVGKFTSVADWRLGALLWGEPYDEEIARRTLAAVQACIERAEAIGRATPDGIRSLMQALIDSGICMLAFGDSRPASGSEHHISHFWEMKLLQEGRPAILHGAKVGVATLKIAELYAQLRGLSSHAAAALARAARNAIPEQEVQHIRAVYGASADAILAAQEPFLHWDEESVDQLVCRMQDRWDEIQAIAHAVPEPAEIARLLEKVGAPTTCNELGFSEQEMRAALRNGHYLRNRFTISKLWHFLGMDTIPG